jgi:hypothetical protein
MMQATNLRNRGDPAPRRWFHITRHRRVTNQRQMWARVVIVFKVRIQHAFEMGFAKHDDVIDALSAYRADDAFAIRILPGRAWCDGNFFDAHAFDASLEVVAVDSIPIADEKTGRFFVREGIDDLLGGPFGVRIRGHVEVNDQSPVVTEHDEDVQHAEGHGWHATA